VKWIILIVLVLVGVYFYPQLNEGTSSACGALEKRYIRTASSGSDAGKVVGALFTSGNNSGDLAASFVKTKQPNLPAPLGCAMYYYQIMFDPDVAKLDFTESKQ
jgi:hypothetical protein